MHLYLVYQKIYILFSVAEKYAKKNHICILLRIEFA